MGSIYKLSDIGEGDTVYIKNIKGIGPFKQRLGEMGFVRGKRVTVVKNAPLNDPIEFSIMGYNISLRRNEASQIEVTHKELKPIYDEELLKENFPGSFNFSRKATVIKVAIVGNPNSGKTTIFNFATKSHEHVGNYTGVTVSSKTTMFKQGEVIFELTDLPGTYSISAFSPEELFVRKYILENKPDVVLNVLDASNLERNLFLTTQLVDMEVKVVVALNMFDELYKLGDRFDYQNLGKMLGIPFIPTIGSRNRGIRKLFQKITEVYTGKDASLRKIKINYGVEVENSINRIITKLSNFDSIPNHIPLRYLALQLLCKDKQVLSLFNREKHRLIISVASEETTRIENLLKDTIDSVIADARYGFISGALKETYQIGTDDRRKLSDSIDTLLTNKYFGFPVFLLFMWVMFSATFNLGGYPQSWIENGVSLLSSFISENMPEGSLKHLITDGIIGGVGGVIVFLPNIIILFLFISVMEDTGYMARAAFITDKLMHKIGLHGKSFIPLIMGFGCNVPAIMATRTIENKNNRLLTILINPFMSCSARLPVYILLIGAIFPQFKGTILFSIYLIGILVAILVALIFKSTLFKSNDAPFVMELPPYRLPTIRSITKHMWTKASQYLKKMGGIIMIASILIWALGHYPVQKNEPSGTSASIKTDSYIAQVGKFIEPAIQPLGFDWRMGVCLMTGVAAKEIVVSTMGVIYSDNSPNESSKSLGEKINNARYTNGKNVGKKVFTPLATFSFLVFTLLYFPCLPTVTAIYNESGTWKWALFSVVFTTGLAWVLSFLIYQTGLLLS